MYDWDITSLFPKETTVLQAGTTVVWHALGAALNMSMGAAAGEKSDTVDGCEIRKTS
jgi:hypothetical protein